MNKVCEAGLSKYHRDTRGADDYPLDEHLNDPRLLYGYEGSPKVVETSQGGNDFSFFNIRIFIPAGKDPLLEFGFGAGGGGAVCVCAEPVAVDCIPYPLLWIWKDLRTLVVCKCRMF